QQARVPAAAEQHADPVPALAKRMRHVIRLVLQPMPIAGPARREQIVAYLAAVHVELIYAGRSRIDARRSNVPPQLHTLAEHMNRLILRLRLLTGSLALRTDRDPLRLPTVRLQQPGLPP